MYALRSSVAAAVLAVVSAGVTEPPLELGSQQQQQQQQQPITLNWASHPVRAGASHSVQPVPTSRVVQAWNSHRHVPVIPPQRLIARDWS